MAANVEFDEEEYGLPAQNYYQSEEKGLTKWLISKNIVKNKSQAHTLLLIVITVIFIISLIVFASTSGGRSKPVDIDINGNIIR